MRLVIPAKTSPEVFDRLDQAQIRWMQVSTDHGVGRGLYTIVIPDGARFEEVRYIAVQACERKKQEDEVVDLTLQVQFHRPPRMT